jgi:class 3 adenylate cyclase
MLALVETEDPASASAAEAPAVRSDAGEPGAKPRLAEAAGPARLLVVDDNEMNRDMLSRRLSGRGYAVEVAKDGHEALAAVEGGSFDVILLDVMMPELSGIEVLKRIRHKWSESDLPVVMATARDASQDVVEALKLGANDYVTKPLDFPVVLARVETQIGLKRQKEEIHRLAQDLDIRNRFIQQTFGRYLSEEIVRGLLDSPEGLKLGGESRRVTLLMSDLRGFTSISEALSAEQVVRLLNSYLGAMAEVILKHQGTIDEFVGDAILAIFGAPVKRADDARRALACAVEMQLAIETLNERNAAEGLPRLEMGIAVHTGEVVVGNIGSEKRTKYGVVGPPINLTGRIESFTVGGQILISSAVCEEAGDVVQVGDRLSIAAKGAREPLTVFELRGIAGGYDLYLFEKRDEMRPLARELAVRYWVVEDKRVGTEAFDGHFVSLAVTGGLVRPARGLRLLSNLKLVLLPEDEEAKGDLYGKVVERREEGEGLFAVRFTSVPPAIEQWLRRRLAG